MREIEATYVVEGQDGRLMWGHSVSTAAPTNEPFGWALSSDNKTNFGADVDGYFHITLVSPDRMEKCYTQNTGAGRAIVATCHFMDRVKRLDRIVNVADIQLRQPRVEGDVVLLTASCTATTFRFLDEQERKTRAEQQKAKGGS